MAIRSTFTTGEVLTAADLTDTIKGAFINTETTTARTLGTADAGNLVTLNNNSGGTVTIPTNTTWGSPLGTLVHLINIGTAGSFTVGTAAGVTLNAASATMAIQEGGTLIKTATNTWQFVKGGGLGKAQYSSVTGSPTVTTVSGKTCVQFTGSGSITISTAGLVEVLLVGGGGGGANYGGGGGGGGVNYLTSAYLPVGSFTVTVGGGGTGGTSAIALGVANGQNGNISGISTNVIGPGGGGGGTGSGAGGANRAEGLNGASGGGAGLGQTANGGSAYSGLGNSGGSGNATAPNYGAGGGGGATAVGANGTATTGGNGGAGSSNSITGSAVLYGSGGGGGSYNGGTAGTGGTNAGNGTTNNTTAGAGTANRGGGGGGGGYASGAGAAGGNGGSGIVILLFG